MSFLRHLFKKKNKNLNATLKEEPQLNSIQSTSTTHEMTKKKLQEGHKKSKEKSKKKLLIVEDNVDSLTPNEVSSKDLTVIKQLGKGIYGKVCLGVWGETSVAIKCTQVTSKNPLEFCQRETDIMHEITQLGAINCVKMYGVIERDLNNLSSYSFIMEYAPHSLWGEIETIDDKRCYKIFKEIVKGVNFLHTNDIMHCDLKPDNILLDEKYHVKICDFGLARKIGTEGCSGSYAYIGPEILLGGFNTPKSDIYSLGMTLWAMVAKKEPYEGRRGSVLTEIADGLREPIPKNCNLKLSKVIRWCWSNHPDDRPTSTELSLGLESFSKTLSAKLG